ncbi:MAG: BTB/POZ domain-containing protein [Chlamydiales bacterium]|nr:BTB/POZ domain-containing protein [Chlamydiales bacterium]
MDSLPAPSINPSSQIVKVTVADLEEAVSFTCKATQVEELTDHHANLVIGMFRRCAPATAWAAENPAKMTQVLRSVTKFYSLAHPNTKILGGDVRSRCNTQINAHLDKFGAYLPKDVALLGDTEEVIPASALVLIHRSDLFDKLLCGNFDESRKFIETYPIGSENPSFALRMGGISTEALKTLVDFLSKGEITGKPTVEVLAHLYQTSDYWNLNPDVEQAFKKALLDSMVINENQVDAYYVLLHSGETERANTCLHNIVEKWSNNKLLGYLEGKRDGLEGVEPNKLKFFCQNQVMNRLYSWLDASDKNKKKIARFEALAPQFLCNLNNFVGDMSKLHMFHGYWLQDCMSRK